MAGSFRSPVIFWLVQAVMSAVSVPPNAERHHNGHGL